MTPNPSESPMELARVLAKIAEIERRPGYKGPKIYPEIELAERVLYRSSKLRYYAGAQPWEIDTPPAWFEVVIVGTIARAVRRGDNQDGAEMGFDARINGTFSATITFWRWGVMQKVIRRFGDSLALAAANAYMAAIGGGEKDCVMCRNQ